MLFFSGNNAHFCIAVIVIKKVSQNTQPGESGNMYLKLLITTLGKSQKDTSGDRYGTLC